MAGKFVMHEARKRGAEILPVDSEHSAIFQCLKKEGRGKVSRLILTASGGPFLEFSFPRLKSVTPEEALRHPTWEMGEKVTVDSATLMNKGLEIIEAHYLFNLSYDDIEVVIHPQSVIHSMVEFIDGSIKAHMGPTDMRIPIQYALSYPERLPSPIPMLNLLKVDELTFEEPDLVNFPCLGCAVEAGKKGKTYPAVLNAANEEAVAAFLNGEIAFLTIPEVVDKVLSKHKPVEPVELSVLKGAESWARNQASEIIKTARY